MKYTKKRVVIGNTVRSIQRLSNTAKMGEGRICDEYILWLPRYFKHFIKVITKEKKVSFFIKGINIPLLILEKIEKEEPLERVKFHIVGGALSKTKDTGWLEFRIIANGKYTLALINEFIPSLPWYFYRYTQAIIHAKVMRAFGLYLGRKRMINE